MVDKMYWDIAVLWAPCWLRIKGVVWQHMLPHHCIVHNEVIYRKFLTIVTLASLKYKLPDDGHRPKHVGAF